MRTSTPKHDGELNNGLDAGHVEEVTLRFFRDTRYVYPLLCPSYNAPCWCAELVDPNDRRPVFGRGDTPGEAADALLAELYPAPADDWADDELEAAEENSDRNRKLEGTTRPSAKQAS